MSAPVLNQHFVAVVTHGTYSVFPVADADDAFERYTAQSCMGFVFPAEGQEDAQLIANTILPHPEEVRGFVYATETDLYQEIYRPVYR